MSHENQSETLTRDGIIALREGNKKKAAQLLYRATQLDATNQVAWLWLADIVNNDADRQRCLEHIIAINPDNAHGKQAAAALEQLQAPPPEEARSETPPTHEPETPPAHESEPEQVTPPPSPPEPTPTDTTPIAQAGTITQRPARIYTVLLSVMTFLLILLVASNGSVMVMMHRQTVLYEAAMTAAEEAQEAEETRTERYRERLDDIAVRAALQQEIILELMDSYERGVKTYVPIFCANY